MWRTVFKESGRKEEGMEKGKKGGRKKGRCVFFALLNYRFSVVSTVFFLFFFPTSISTHKSWAQVFIILYLDKHNSLRIVLVLLGFPNLYLANLRLRVILLSSILLLLRFLQ